MKKFITPFRVGLLVIASGIFFFIFLTFIKKGGMSDKEAIRIFAYFKDASGLGKKSRVQIAGIVVGEVSDISLKRVTDKSGTSVTMAEVWLKVRREVGLRKDASVTKKSESLLGDYQLDLVPGTAAAPEMEEGGEIHVIDEKGMQAIFESLSKITEDIQEVTSSLRRVLGGDKGTGSLERIMDNLIKLSDSVERTVRESAEKLDNILGNFQAFSADVKNLTQGQDAQIKQIIENVNGVTRDVRDVLATVKQILGSGEGEFKQSVASLKETLNRVNNSLENVEQITGKIRDGKGAVGALLTDERLGQKISETVDDVADYAGRLTRIQAEVGVRSEYLVSQGTSKNAITIKLSPRPDKYYLLEVIDDPRGQVDTQIIQTNPPGSGQPVTQIQRITSEKLKFSAQFGKRFYFTTLRFGIIESTGGLGADFHILNDLLTVKLDAFNFSVDYLRYPRIRAAVRLTAFEHLYVTAGMDDMLNSQERDKTTNKLIAGRDVFFGGGIFFTDDDLKAILSVAPVKP